jgi:pseudouridine-5'-phosphate glycosidase
MNQFLDVADEVTAALREGKAVVALESTIISHGMPYPKNAATAREVERIVRAEGAVPATIAILGGRLKAGLTEAEINYLAKKGPGVTNTSRRDIPFILAGKADGATTVAATMIIANMAGIRVFCTGGIGGVHRGAEKTMDISADLPEFSRTPVLVVCAGAKSILDLGLTLEYLETAGVPVMGYRTNELPAFFTRASGFTLPHRVDSAEEAAAAFSALRGAGLSGGAIVANPLPEAYSLDAAYIQAKIDEAVAQAEREGVRGKDLTPYLLAKIDTISGGKSLEANIQLVYNNARLAAAIAKALALREKNS